jgi:hypothetical protein
LPAKKNTPGHYAAQRSNGIAQSGAIFLPAPARRTRGSFLPVGQVTTQHSEADIREGIGQRNQHGRAAVRSGSVREHQTIGRRIRATMQKATNCRCGSRVCERLSDYFCSFHL